MHCHHEKLVIVDGEVAFVGGIDLTSLGGDRFDTSDHPMRGRLGWHDASSRVRGPAVADVAAHFAARWREVTGEQIEADAAAAPAGDVELQVVRTVPEKVYDFLPEGDFRIFEAYTRALRSARKLVYLESQFLWSPQVVEILAEQASRAAERRLSRRRVAARKAEQRRGHDPRPARRAGSTPTTGPVVFWPRRSRPEVGDSPARCTFTPRSGSSTTPG